MAAAAFASQSKQLYNLTPCGRAFLITCSVPSACDFYGQNYLTIASGAGNPDVVAFWNDDKEGWIVRGRDYVYAEAFTTYLNNKQQTDEVEAAEALVDLAHGQDNFTLTKHGRGFLIECNDPSECAWWGEKYIALTNQKDAATAFWNDALGGYVVRGRDAEEAEFFVHTANRPCVPRAPQTPPRPTRVTRTTPPPAPKKSRTFATDATGGGEVRFTRATARRLFEAEQAVGRGGDVVEDEEDDTSDEEYVPSDDEEDDDALFEEVVYQPYKGMMLRKRRSNCVVQLYFLTCGADHKLYGRPYLGYPAAKAVRANCWKVEPNMEKQYIDGGARFEE